MKFMNLPEEYSKEDSYFAIFPIRYEKDVTYGKGASKGPDAIIEASEHLEYYDEEFNVEAFEKGIIVHDPGKIPEEPEKMIDFVRENFPKNKFVVSLGGDHAVSLGCVPEDCSVLILDAHSDLRDSWGGRLNHGCVSKQLSKNHKVGIIGVRSQDIDEVRLQPKNVHILKRSLKIDELLDKLDSKVYISIDVDVFDPAFIRNTGTPEPGGLMWDEVINILKKVFEKKEVIGADIVEFSPEENFRAEAYSLAKLAYKIMSLKSKLAVNPQ